MLAPKGFIKTALGDPHGLQQILEGGGLIPLTPKQAHGRFQRLIDVKFPWTSNCHCHGLNIGLIGPLVKQGTNGPKRADAFLSMFPFIDSGHPVWFA